jgi:deazaflavin-dependent oxidoreductase (nitroreductase family)
LNHVGRKSGLQRQAVLEVVGTDPATDTYYVASGWGRASDWFQNVQANPEVTLKVGRRELAARAEVLDREESGEMMVDYARRNPRAAQALSKVIGLAVEGTEEGYREVGREHVPFVALRPVKVLQQSPTTKEVVVPLLVVGGVLAGMGELWRRAGRGDQE